MLKSSCFYLKMLSLLSVVALASCGYLPVEDDRDFYDTQILQVEETVMLVIPSDQLFFPGTANYIESYQEALDGVVTYLNTNHIGHVAVSAFENSSYNEKNNRLVALAQTHKITAYLNDKLASPAWIVAQSKVDQKPVTRNASAPKNRRIELSFNLHQ